MTLVVDVPNRLPPLCVQIWHNSTFNNGTKQLPWWTNRTHAPIVWRDDDGLRIYKTLFR